MSNVVKDVIYLGTLSDADTDEGSTDLENTSIYLQSFGSAGSPLIDSLEQVTFNDADDNGSIDTDNFPTSDTVTTVAGTVKLDSLVVAEMTVTYSDGSTVAHVNVVMFQTDDGDLFLANSNFAGTDISGTGSQTIQSINVTSVDDGFAGLWHNAFQGFACYLSGTMISTPDGARRIDELQVGDQVLTGDNGAQPLRWVGRSDVVSAAAMTPVRIRKGAMGHGRPTRDLLVSQQHRMMVSSPIIERMFGITEAFVAAKNLLPLAGWELANDLVIARYYHLMCDQHEVVFANGVPSETFLPGPQALDMVGPDACKELEALFPDIKRQKDIVAPARPILHGSRQRTALRRHIKNNKPVLRQGSLDLVG